MNSVEARAFASILPALPNLLLLLVANCVYVPVYGSCVYVCSSHILDPRKRDVAFTTASSEGEQTMRKDVECQIPAAAVADGKCIIASYFIEGNEYNNNN